MQANRRCKKTWNCGDADVPAQLGAAKLAKANKLAMRGQKEIAL